MLPSGVVHLTAVHIRCRAGRGGGKPVPTGFWACDW